MAVLARITKAGFFFLSLSFFSSPEMLPSSEVLIHNSNVSVLAELEAKHVYLHLLLQLLGRGIPRPGC